MIQRRLLSDVTQKPNIIATKSQRKTIFFINGPKKNEAFLKRSLCPSPCAKGIPLGVAKLVNSA